MRIMSPLLTVAMVSVSAIAAVAPIIEIPAIRSALANLIVEFLST